MTHNTTRVQIFNCIALRRNEPPAYRLAAIAEPGCHIIWVNDHDGRGSRGPVDFCERDLLLALAFTDLCIVQAGGFPFDSLSDLDAIIRDCFRALIVDTAVERADMWMRACRGCLPVAMPIYLAVVPDIKRMTLSDILPAASGAMN